MSTPIQPYRSTYGSMDSTTPLSSDEKKEARLKEIAIAKADLNQRIENIKKSRATDSASPYIKSDEDRLKADLVKLTNEEKALKGESDHCTIF